MSFMEVAAGPRGCAASARQLEAKWLRNPSSTESQHATDPTVSIELYSTALSRGPVSTQDIATRRAYPHMQIALAHSVWDKCATTAHQLEVQ